jgi:hypothetical protein
VFEGGDYIWTRRYAFEFPTLDANAVVVNTGQNNNAGNPPPCVRTIIDTFIETPPTIELVFDSNLPDFCNTSPTINGYQAVGGPFGTVGECGAGCGNPLP